MNDRGNLSLTKPIVMQHHSSAVVLTASKLRLPLRFLNLRLVLVALAGNPFLIESAKTLRNAFDLQASYG